MFRTLLVLCTACLLIPVACAKPEPVSASEILISKGPDGEAVYTPRSDSVPVAGLAQYLQLVADLKHLSPGGYFLDTQAANLRGQVNLLRRAEYLGWHWEGIDGAMIDIPAQLAQARSRLKTLDAAG